MWAKSSVDTFTFSEALEHAPLEGQGQLREALQAKLVRTGSGRCLAHRKLSPVVLFGARSIGNIV